MFKIFKTGNYKYIGRTNKTKMEDLKMITKLDDELLKVTNEFSDCVLGDIIKHLINVVRDIDAETNKDKAVELIQEWL